MQGLDPRMPFGIQAITALVKKELAAHNKPNIKVSIAIYPHLLPVENLSLFYLLLFRFSHLLCFLFVNNMAARYQVEAVNLVPIRKKRPKHLLFMILITRMTHTSDDWTTVIDWSAAFKSLFNVTTFINEQQVLIYDKFKFIINPQSIYKYVHSSCIKHMKQFLSELVNW